MSEFRDFLNEQLKDAELRKEYESMFPKIDAENERQYDYQWDMYCDEFDDLDEKELHR